MSSLRILRSTQYTIVTSTTTGRWSRRYGLACRYSGHMANAFAQSIPEDGILVVNLNFDLMVGADEVLDEKDEEDDDNDDDEEPPEVRDPNTQS
jgi:hypothetical protein